VISHAFWQTRLGGAQDIAGRAIRINGSAWVVVGVTPPGFGGLDRAYQRDLFVPMGMKPQVTPGWNGLDKPMIAWLYIAGRLKPGVDRERLGSELNAKFHMFQETHLPEERSLSAAQRKMIRGRHLGLEPLSDAVFESRVAGHISTMGWMVGLLLGLACVNVAGLMLARGIERRRELATRLSIGASRGRIIGQLLTEALLLALGGGAAGLAGAAVIAPLLASRFPLAGSGSRLDVPLDWTVPGFTFAVSLLACLLFGLAPAWQATKLDLVAALKGAMPTVSANRMRNVLLAAQAGVSVVLLCAAGLFSANLRALLVKDTGFDRQRLLLAEVEPTLSGYDNAARLKLYGALEKRMQEMRGSGFVSATLSNVAPMSPYHWSSLFLVKGRERTEDRLVRAVAVGANYFDTMRIPLRAGRLPEDRDDADAPRVAVISESLARLEFPDESPIGRRFTADLREPEKTTFEIVGVVGDTNLHDPRERHPSVCVYLPYRQWVFTPQAVVVQARLAPGAPVATAADMLRQALRDVDPSMAFYDVRTIEQASDAMLAGERLAALLTTFFGVAAALLFAVGIHGVVSRDLAVRAKEAAIRVVLGGQAAQVVWALARGPLLAAGGGLAVGVILLAGIAPMLSSLLTSVRPADPVFVAGAAAILLVMAAAAVAVPAWRVRNLQPAAVLKKD
jgi:predicted permease